MAKHGRVGVLVLLLPAFAVCGALADRWNQVRRAPQRVPLPVAATRSLDRTAPLVPPLSEEALVYNQLFIAAEPSAAAMPAAGTSPAAGPLPGRATRDVPATTWSGDQLIASETAARHVVFVDYAPGIAPHASAWPRAKMAALSRFYNLAIVHYYGGARGFGSIDVWADACGVSLAIPIVLTYDPHHPHDPQPTAKWHAGQVPVITYGPTIRTRVASHGLRLAVHELAHVWDGAHDWSLSRGLAQVVQNSGNYPTARARDGGPLEDFAESVTAYLVDGYASNERWSDDDPRFYTRLGVQADEVWELDRHDYVARLFAGATVAEIRAEATELSFDSGLRGEDGILVPDR